ncbi:MAG TPA: hypothetical protein VGN15_08800, partial [Ktedonobacteraceae bacterium]|nr:hypothetical protein [Ktedonobacteraceae bacterium]
ADPDGRKLLREQMEEFFFGAQAKMPEGWVAEGDDDDSVAAGAKGGGQSSKGGGGGGAARKK